MASAVTVIASFLVAQFLNKPRVLTVAEVPLAFWAWRVKAPSEAEVRKVWAATKAQTLFLRAGQFDCAGGTVQRIRPATGALPTAVDLHLVYNGTRKFLRELESLDVQPLAATIAATYQTDLTRARQEHAQVSGVQLDFDVPSRLLPRYAQLLAQLRASLPSGTKLSITGLPTWAYTREIQAVLAVVDFWIPQCYGAKLPAHLSQQIPISSPQYVAQTIRRIRQLGKPFYAGLSAYSYAILYAKDGSLVELRGDLDPAWAAHNASLELVERQAFQREASTSEMRYVYRAQADIVLDGLIIQAGESLVFDLPSAETLRASARAVRENAGEQLLGICVFRLPGADDKTVLSLGEIVAALSDQDCVATTTITPQTLGQQRLQLRLENTGNARTVLAEDALTIELAIPPGGLSEAPQIKGFSSVTTLCRVGEATVPCSQRRANVLRLRASSWPPESVAWIDLQYQQDRPSQVPVTITTRVNDGRTLRESLTVAVPNNGE